MIKYIFSRICISFHSCKNLSITERNPRLERKNGFTFHEILMKITMPVCCKKSKKKKLTFNSNQ